MTTTAIYARVSSGQQDTRAQEMDLKVWATQQEVTGAAVEWFKDKATGTNFD